MSMYKVYLITDNGEGMVTELLPWDGEDPLTLHLKAFAPDAVITIEPDIYGKLAGL